MCTLFGVAVNICVWVAISWFHVIWGLNFRVSAVSLLLGRLGPNRFSFHIPYISHQMLGMLFICLDVCLCIFVECCVSFFWRLMPSSFVALVIALISSIWCLVSSWVFTFLTIIRVSAVSLLLSRLGHDGFSFHIIYISHQMLGMLFICLDVCLCIFVECCVSFFWRLMPSSFVALVIALISSIWCLVSSWVFAILTTSSSVSLSSLLIRYRSTLLEVVP